LGLIEVKIVEEIVTYISQHDFTRKLRLLLPKKTYSNQVIVEPIAKRVNFAKLHQYLQVQKYLRQTIEADLNY
tara:strand:- start:2307 stop:2525 length:219 start_codon:yes stop_codon:yes gene_type:complete